MVSANSLLMPVTVLFAAIIKPVRYSAKCRRCGSQENKSPNSSTASRTTCGNSTIAGICGPSVVPMTGPAVVRQAKTPALDPKTPIFPTPFESLQKSSSMVKPEHDGTLYDADRQVLQVQTWLVENYLGGGSRSSAVERQPQFSKVQTETLKEVKNYKGTYVGENAFGAKSDVLKMEESIYCLIFNNVKDFGIAAERSITKATFEAQMDVATAKAAKSDLRILFLYRLVSPFTQEGDHHHFSPTRERSDR